MNDFIWRLKWLFSNSGILGHSPTSQEVAIFMVAKRAPHPYKCKVCGKQAWSFKQVSVCHRFKCFMQNGGWN